MDGRLGILAAILSSALGGSSGAVTRYLISTTDPVTLTALRFGTGFLCLLPLALFVAGLWPTRRDWPAVAGLGLLFFGLFSTVFNEAMRQTTAARGAMALSTLPLLTMVVAAGLGVERLTARKTLGVLIAIGGVALALLGGLGTAPDGAWKGDLTMAGGALLMALYSIWSRPYLARIAPLAFATVAMGSGAAAATAYAAIDGGFAATTAFDWRHWLAVLYLGVLTSALSFFLWMWALCHASPTQVTATITVHPVSAALLASVLVAEPIGWNLALGVVAVAAGLWIASTMAIDQRRAGGV